MELLPIIALFSVLFVASHAALSPEAYWNSVLQNTPMPKAVKDLLNPGKGVVRNSKIGSSTLNIGHKNVEVKAGQSRKEDDSEIFNYVYGSSNTQLCDNRSRAIFFLENDMKPGKSMKFGFPKSDGDASFLARSDAEKISFSSEKMSEVFDLYNVSAGSEEGMMMTKTIKKCEEPPVKGEEKSCATSLESMIDFSTSKLGKQVRVLSSKVDEIETKLQNYTIINATKMRSNKVVVCHKQPYPYAVFYCHYTRTTRPYKVFMAGAHGLKVETVVVCHTDTSAWNPKHLAFQVLKVQPGTVPVCHFLPEDHIIWVAN